MINTDYTDTLKWADECMRDLQLVPERLPLGYLQDYAAANGFSQEIRNSLDTLVAAASVLTYDGPEVIDAFANAGGDIRRTDEARARA